MIRVWVTTNLKLIEISINFTHISFVFIAELFLLFCVNMIPTHFDILLTCIMTSELTSDVTIPLKTRSTLHQQAPIARAVEMGTPAGLTGQTGRQL